MFNIPAQRFRSVALILTFAYQAVAILVFIAAIILGFVFMNTPFIGVFVENSMVTNGIGPISEASKPAWDLYNQGLNRTGDQLQTINGIPIKNYWDMYAILGNLHPGENVQAVFLVDGKPTAYTVTLHDFPAEDQTSLFFIPVIVGLIYLLVSLWIFGFRRSETAGRAFIIFSASVAIALSGLFDIYATNALVYFYVMAVPLVGGALMELALVFPQETRISNRYPFVRYVSYGIAGVLVIMNWASLYNFADPTRYVRTWSVSYGFTGIAVLFYLAVMIYRSLGASSPVIRVQARTILVGALLGFGMITYYLITNALQGGGTPFDSRSLIPIIFFPLTTGYTVLRYRLMRTDYMLSRGILYGLFTIGASVGYMVLVAGLNLLLGDTILPNHWIPIGLAVFLSVLLLNPIRERLQEVINGIFFRGERAHQQRLKNFSRDLTSVVALPDIVRILREQVSVSLLPDHLHIYLYDGLNDQYATTPDDSGRPSSDIRFSAGSVLPQTLRRQKLPLFIDLDRLPPALQIERGRLSLLGAQLFIPLPGRERLIGWLAMGERLSGENYASHDLSFLEALADQAAVAIERAQIVSNLERRVQEMNVLARVAQGINITLNFDDILELIYAQTSQIVPGTDFHLTLFNKTGQYFYYAFCLENDDRLRRQENTPMPSKSSLDQEIVGLHRPIITLDYARECQSLGVTSLLQGVYGWMGVPLNTGAETIGALSVGARDPNVTYTAGQMEIMQAIADQAAGAIVKARLLQETERRAQQLQILNVITRQLTSTLEPEPLLNSILENAVNILNCEAGSLFLVDAQTDELLFKVTVGPVASNLVGQRLPPGTGFVGKAVVNREPVIVNNVQGSTQWNPSTDKQTGFVTKAILAVPMEVKDRVIGVIEIINKKDGQPFTIEDQNLLAAFGGQAAVALENARLYTLTDQELNDRVEELSVMQRIDRELNASLEVDRAMRITLEWAMRQSRAEAGFIGVMQAKGVRLVAQQGYGSQLTAYDESLIPLDHPALKDALSSGQPQRITLSGQPGYAFLAEAFSQMVIPIRREAQVIGLFLLESANREERGTSEALNFLSRLSDHAAIALANAQLYDEVQQANNAKSEFVSFVAHELKNPMTSIKGYSELLASGAVGQISEMQSNFLSTIRSNIERMKTIVEDLNDNSKIEAGRLRLDYKAVAVDEVVDDTIKSTRRQIEEKKQTITIAVAPTLPKVWADRTRFGQVLVNLVSNAHKYTQEGGEIVVGAEQAENIWDQQGASAVVHLWVQDNGIGMAPEDQHKVFQKFFRSEDDQARKSPGTGLGLNITKSLVEMQGGKIWFESEYRKGTTFHMTIPISQN
jgi:signal transduction histidine kinase